jgi:Na+/H+-dicarboxylate symporter/ABC-type amino acid transport substrate-binding protein
VIASLVLGILAGIFFGEPIGRLDILGEAYIKLLQMTVLPYILVSLIGGLGRLDMQMAKRIGLRGGGLILFLWLLAFITLLFLPLAYPSWASASFFSSSLVIEDQTVDLLNLYIPANPFNSLSNTVVPAIVLFSVFLGVAMITVNNKDNFLLSMHNLSDALMKIASVVAKVAPIGIFALSAAAAGTLEVEQLSRLQVYLWVYLLAWGVFAVFTLPMLVAWATPFTYSEVFKEAKLAMVTAFATGTVLVVLPMIAEKTKDLLAEYQMESDDADSAIDVLVPTAYSFPSVGTLLGIGFILFAAWFNGSPLGPTEYPAYTIMGILTAFGTLAVAIPFLLDFFKLPADLFELYLLGSVFTMRFGTALAAMHGIVISLLGACAMMNLLKWRKIMEITVISLLITSLLMMSLGFILNRIIPYEYTGYQALVTMELAGPVVKVNNDATPEPLSVALRSQSRIDVIRSRGTLRVGYFKDRLPFAFRNEKGEVVGYDMELMHVLARDLGVTLEIVKLEWERVSKALADGEIDIAVGGISMSPQRALDITFSNSYRDEYLGLIVPDHRRTEFSSYEKLLARKDLKLGATKFRYEEGSGERLFPDAKIIELETPREYLKHETAEIDALIYTAETAAAWTLVYPDWTVVVPKGLAHKSPIGFALPNGHSEWQNFINTWLDLNIKAGVGEKAYQYWILGESPGSKELRWSVVRDVLGWQE